MLIHEALLWQFRRCTAMSFYSLKSLSKMTKLVWFTVGLSPLTVQAAPLDLRHAPLFLVNPLSSNVFFMLDDSGSMDWEFLIGPEYYYKAYWNSNSADDEIHESSGRWLARNDPSRIGNAAYHSDAQGEDIYYSYMYDSPNNLRNDDPGVDTHHHVGQISEVFANALKYDWRARSAQFNRIYYNPEVNYKPWSGFPNADFTAVRANPIDFGGNSHPGAPGYSTTRNLGVGSGFVYEVAIDNRGYSGTAPEPGNATTTANGSIDLWDEHIRYTVTAGGIHAKRVRYNGAFSDCTDSDVTSGTVPYAGCLGAAESNVSFPLRPFGRTLAEEKQNIANWYQYHRRRMLSMKYILSTLTNEYANFRYGLGYINNQDMSEMVEMPGFADDLLVHNQMLNNKLFEFLHWPDGTPLRGALQNVGEYYRGNMTGKTSPIYAECQHNFTLLVSDGYWNGSDPTLGNTDGDPYSNTLADVARFYYDTDLRTDLDNEVPNIYDELGGILDGNNKQHMTTYSIAFGVNGKLQDTDNDGWPNPPLTEDSDWGDPSEWESTERLDDMWHAAFNSKGKFLAAFSPNTLVNQLKSALGEIGARTGSNASISLSGSVISEDSILMKPSFNLLDRTGNLVAFNIDPSTGKLLPNSKWDAASLLNAKNPNSREIITLDVANDKQVPFRWNRLSDDQKAQLANEENILGYIRGKDSQEIPAGPYRKRNGRLLGPIVHSPALYVGNPNRNYPTVWDSGPESDYKLFRNAFVASPRVPVAYVGGNDGMLHAFNAVDGQELFAYVPNAVMSSLPDVASASVPYISTVDGQLYAEDAFISEWRTLLAGGFRLGAQGVFLMDVTNPSAISESSSERALLWEFTDKNDADMGYVYGQPAIGRMQNGKWVVIFGNGYNNTETDGDASASGNAVLYIVDAETGGLIKKLDTGLGSATSPNGLAEPAIVDIDGDSIIDYIYAGDLEGRLWKFDVTGDASNWKVANSGNALFKAENGSGVTQPITVKPNVMKMRATQGGYLVLFGTGRYMANQDAVAPQDSEQSFYAIWDDETGTAVNRSKLVKREVIAETAIDDVKIRMTTSNDVVPINFGTDTGEHRGWYLELPSSAADQERIVSDPILRNGEIYFATYNPSIGGDVCELSATGSIMVLNARTGGPLSYDSVLDDNGKGLRDSAGKIPGGIVIETGGPTSVVVTVRGNKERFMYGDTEENIGGNDKQPSPAAYGRQTFREITTF